MSLHDAWTALRHGGNLLSPTALDSLSIPKDTPWGLADRLRSALVALDPEKPAPTALGALLDVVLEDTCGLRDGWQKGNALGAADAEKLLDGTVLKPRRRWTGPGGEVLAVFTTPAARIGVGKGRRPAAQVVEYLRRRAIPLGLLTNGRQWRLVWADRDSLAWAEWEAERWLAADLLSDELAVLRRLLAPASLLRAGADLSPLLAAIRDTRRGQAKLSKELGERVRRAVEALLRSRQPVVGPAWEEHEKGDLYVAACHFVMRLVVTLFAEARELLPVDNRVYHQAYGLRGLLDQLDRLTPERRKARHMAWPRLLALFRLLYQGSPHPAVTLPAYGGDLFRPGADGADGVQRALALLESLPESGPDDDVIHRVLVLLTRTTQKVREGGGWRTVAAPVDFTELTSEYIGILYEGLLDYELHRAGSEPVLFLNLGDQPALPLDRLEAMDDKALAALVEKAKVKKQIASAEEEEEDDGDAESLEENESAEEDGAGEEQDLPAVTDALDLDDARVGARARAIAWGRRAVKVGKLVKKPRGRTAEARAAEAAQLDAAADQLVADVKLPGELYLVRWGGTRKGAGTFYTRPQLTLPTVRRTLEPLLYEQPDGTVRLPETLLSLKVCDPAMGSGSFLVAALRVLTEAVVESLHVHKRIERTNERTVVRCELLPEADRSLPSEGFEERLEAIVRRAVVEHCLYGVDIDPLAVELARVALWIETLDRRLPFTFLDHKLQCGNSLVGAWLDDLQAYPVAAWKRESPDHHWEGVNHAPSLWHKKLTELRKVVQLLADADVVGQKTLFEGSDSDSLRTALSGVRQLYSDIQRIPASRPDLRAMLWKTRILTDERSSKVRRYLDSWCAVWFWPYQELSTAPTPSDLADRALEDRTIRKISEDLQFFHWELAFPDAFSSSMNGGFDAVVGNPPWETIHAQTLEFFSNHNPLYRALTPTEVEVARNHLFTAEPEVENSWLHLVGRVKSLTNWIRHVGGRNQRPFRLQGEGKPYTHRIFLELALHLTRAGGRIGMILPSSMATEKGSILLRKEIIDRNNFEWFYDFENRQEVFPIHRSSRFAAIILQRGGATKLVKAAVMEAELERWGEQAPTSIAMEREFIAHFSPEDYMLPLFGSPRDTEIMRCMLSDGVVFHGDGTGEWGIQYSRELNMSDDKGLFHRRDVVEAIASPTSQGDYMLADHGRLLPLIEGRNVAQFQAFAKRWVSGKGRGAVWVDVEPGTLATGAQYYLPYSDVVGSRNVIMRPKVAVMDVTGATNTRSIIASCIPAVPSGHSVNNASFPQAHDPLNSALHLDAILNSFCFDWIVRQRLAGQHVSRYFLKDVALPKRRIWPTVSLLVLRLNAIHPSFAAWWQEIADSRQGYRRTWATTIHERLRLRCMLDAIVTVLYGLDRDDFAWILKDCDHLKSHLSNKAFCRQLDPKGFWRVDKTEDPELRHTVLSLAAFDDLQAAIAAAGDRDEGIAAFCDQNEGDGWMLPETLCLSDLGLTRTVNAGEYDERARTPQPVRSRLGERFLDWQLAQTSEESWAECERHAKAILEGMPEAPRAEPAATDAQPSSPQPRLPGMEH